MRDFLISKKGLVKFFWNQSYDFCSRRSRREEVWIGYSWPDSVRVRRSGAGLERAST